MKNILSVIAVLAFCGMAIPSASAVEIVGQSAKNLYLAMNGFVEQDIIFYSLKKVASTIDCAQSYRSIKYNFHQECQLVDAGWGSKKVKLHDIDYHGAQPAHVEGAAMVIASLRDAKKYSDSGNPPVVSLKVTAECIVHSPVSPPPLEDADSFICKFIDL